MTPFITFRGYGVQSPEVTVAASRVTHFHYINYNGNAGTAIQLDTGKEVLVSDWPSDVEKALVAALQP